MKIKILVIIAFMCGFTAAIGRADIVYNGGINDITTAVTSTVDLEDGVLNIDLGGSVTGSTETDGFGINMTGGTLNIYGNVTGGSGTFAEGINLIGGTVNLYSGGVMGGTSPYYVEGIAMTSGTLNIFGGSIASGNGGYAEGINASGGQINMYHGTVMGGAGTYTYGISMIQSALNLEGGTVTAGGGGLYNSDLDVEAGGGNRLSTADIYGGNFNAPAGPLASGGGTLTGTLADGTALNLSYSQFPVSEIVLVVPEPSTVALAGLGAAAACLWRRKVMRILKAKIPASSAILSAGAVALIATVARGQNLFVTANGTGNIYDYTPGGVRNTFASGLNLPYGLAFDSSGNLFEADQSSGNVYEFAPGGARSTFASGLAQPCGLAFDSAGNLFVSQLGTGPVNSGLITKITPGGVKSTFATGLNPIQPGLAFNNAGNLFMPDGEAQAIDEFTPAGVKSIFATGVYHPRGLAFSSTGNLFVSAANGTNGVGVIYDFTPGGVPTTFASSGLSLPLGLAFNSAGILFVADYGSDNIFEYNSSGTQSTFASGLNAPAGLAFQPVPEPSAWSLLVVGILTLLIRRERANHPRPRNRAVASQLKAPSPTTGGASVLASRVFCSGGLRPPRI